MTSVASRDVEPFETFFRRATGVTPYRYQVRMTEGDELPEAIDVPTGCGKTAAIVIAWLWRLFSASPEIRARTPRRLVLALPFRSLADQTEQAARTWLAALDVEADLYVVMGGRMGESGGWREHPERPSILIGTTDAITSKTLVRGYGVPRNKYALDASHLWNDAHLVVDEVQAAPETTTTLRQIAGFLRGGSTVGPTGLTCMSATLNHSLLDTVDNPVSAQTRVVAVQATDDEPELARRLDARRSILRLAANAAKPRELAVEVRTKHQAGGLTLVIVNTVRAAVELYRALQRAGPDTEVVLLHSRFRPADRASIMETITNAPGPAGRIVVATQVVEAGVDLDANVMITEAAPWSSLVQRAGRLNRAGSRDEASLWWLPPAKTAPYDKDAIDGAVTALDALEGRALTSRELHAAGPAETPPPIRVLRRSDFDSLFDTSPDLTGNDLDIAVYVRDTDELDVQLFWADWNGFTPPDDLRPAEHSHRCRAPLTGVRELIKRRARVCRFDQAAGTWSSVTDPRPGETLAVAAADGGYLPDTGFDPSVRTLVEIPSTAGVDELGEEPFDSDAPSLGLAWVTLDRHLAETRDEAAVLIERLALTENERIDVVLAARLHDVGKAHPTWQDALQRTATALQPVPDPSVSWAKSPQVTSLRWDKGIRTFRHELASVTMLDGAFATLLDGARDRDLVRYLVLAHHGRLRVRVGNPKPDPSGRLLGMLDGEQVPVAGVLDCEAASYTVSLAVFEGRDDVSWNDTVDDLLERYGPFRLAYLETIVRVADWRASARHGPRS